MHAVDVATLGSDAAGGLQLAVPLHCVVLANMHLQSSRAYCGGSSGKVLSLIPGQVMGLHAAAGSSIPSQCSMVTCRSWAGLGMLGSRLKAGD